MKKDKKTQILANAKKVLHDEAKAIEATIKTLDNSFVKAVEKIASCRGRTAIIGIGKSGLIARKIASTLSSTGTPSIFLHPVECLHGDLGALAATDIVMALSHSGQTKEINSLVPILKDMGVFVIAMTGSKKSRLSKSADITLYAPVKYQACPYNIAPTTSTAVMLALGDALAIALMKLKKFKKSDFAKLHPGGSIGKILTLKVKDLMVSGKDNPVIVQNKTVKEALVIMSKTRLGAVSVTDGNGKLVGFFTDGDLRRKMQKQKNTLDCKLSKVMTTHPVSVTAETMAVEAARIIKSKKIDNLPVINSQNRPIGLLDEKNLLEIFPLS